MHPNHKYASISDPVSLKREAVYWVISWVGWLYSYVGNVTLVGLNLMTILHLYFLCNIRHRYLLHTSMYHKSLRYILHKCWRRVHMKILPWQWVILPCTQYMILLCSWGMYWSSIAMATITWGNLRQNCQKDHWYSGLQRHWYNEWTWCHYMYM